MILKEEDFKKNKVIEIAKNMVLAARTAPKGKGSNTIETCILHSDDLVVIADKMKELGNKHAQEFFIRDADNILNSEALILIGTSIKPLGLYYCGLCGMNDCDTKKTNSNVPCAFNTTDLGIAVGSAVSIAADNRIDNRIFYTAGMAALELKLFDDDIKIIYGIVLSASSKNIFFDRHKR